jgi:hypothetical protein
VRVLDLDADGFMDVVIGAVNRRVTRTWRPREQRWQEGTTPVLIATPVKDDGQVDEAVRFGVVRESGTATMLVKAGQTGAWTFRDGVVAG